jgi:hypothetical protein
LTAQNTDNKMDAVVDFAKYASCQSGLDSNIYAERPTVAWMRWSTLQSMRYSKPLSKCDDPQSTRLELDSSDVALEDKEVRDVIARNYFCF